MESVRFGDSAFKFNKPLIVFIGGYPKGFRTAFSLKTKSGRMLWKLIMKYSISCVITDLWKTAEQEQSGLVDEKKINELKRFQTKGMRLVALGNHVANSLKDTGLIYDKLPHPANRRGTKPLENGICKILTETGLIKNIVPSDIVEMRKERMKDLRNLVRNQP